MTGVPRSVAEHRLNIREGYSPVRQKKRGQAPERAKAIQAEVQKLVEAGIMREVYYHDWLSNPVMVKKHDGSWRMCVDFMDLNKAYAYKGYHQIQLAEADEEKTAFHTRQRVYCYTKMPFGLKNAGATYQRLMDKAFEGQVGRNIEVYVNDLVVKSHTEAEMVRDTEETFRTLRKSDFHWTTEAEQAFQQLKQHLSELPLLVAPKPQEELIMYLSATYGAISAVLMTERGACQTPIYFISRALQGPELNYSPMKKLVLSLIFAAKRLRRYFQAHPIVVITDQPIKQVMSRLDVAGRLQKWSIMLGEHNITYRPMTSVKDDLVVKSHKEAEMVRDIEETFRTLCKVNMKLNPKKCSFGLAEGVFLGYVITPEGIKPCPDKTAAVRQLPSPWTIKECGPDDRTGSGSDANLLYKPRVTGSGTKLLADGETGLITDLRSKKTPKIFSGTSYRDASQAGPAAVTQEEQWTLFTDGSSCVDGSGVGLILTNPEGVEFTYALRFQFAASNNEADYEALVAGLRIATQMGVKNVQVNVDCKLVANQVLGTYVAKEDNMIKYMEIVKGLICGFTTFSISQVTRSKNKKADALSKIASTSFAHLSKQVDYVMREIHEGSCSMHAGSRSVVAKAIRLGPLFGRAGEGQIFYSRHGLLHKWIEAKAVAIITGGHVKRFVWDNIVCRFGISGEIISDNGKQFSDNPFKDWCDTLNITQRFASGNKKWVEELPHVIWAHRTMIKSSYGDTPFSLTYGTEAVIPTEIGMPTYRTAVVNVVNNYEELRLNLHLLEERRERVRPGDFVYRSNDASHAVAGGKLGPKWEGPYEVTEALGNKAYKLLSTNGTILPRTWNVANLKRCYL
uniref:Reverse transcriptase domain-containing protein n=1 Tax=Tanacetum cinerariifolium TaxID=118510 RepID=A0A6L2N615_TANCI|nr:reverse transcriptase domain-containing protein [Tanacetum cinerariifolium]